MDYLIRILNIKTQNQEDSDNLDFQMPLILDLIKTKFGHLTIPEIKEAFKMFIGKEFPELKVFRMLDCIVVADVLNAFTEFRNESLRVYDDKKKMMLSQSAKPTEKEVAAIREEFLQLVFDEIQATGICSSAYLLFDDLGDRLTVSNAVKKRLYRFQDRKYIRELRADVAKQGKHPHHIELLELAQKNSKEGKLSVIVQNKCRSIVVCNYLKGIKDFNEFKKAIKHESIKHKATLR